MPELAKAAPGRAYCGDFCRSERRCREFRRTLHPQWDGMTFGASARRAIALGIPRERVEAGRRFLIAGASLQRRSRKGAASRGECLGCWSRVTFQDYLENKRRGASFDSDGVVLVVLG